MQSKSFASGGLLDISIIMFSLSTTLFLACSILSLRSAGVQAEVAGNPDVSTSLQQILDQAHKGPLYTYPTSLTQGIIPVCFAESRDERWKGAES